MPKLAAAALVGSSCLSALLSTSQVGAAKHMHDGRKRNALEDPHELQYAAVSPTLIDSSTSATFNINSSSACFGATAGLSAVDPDGTIGPSLVAAGACDQSFWKLELVTPDTTTKPITISSSDLEAGAAVASVSAPSAKELLFVWNVTSPYALDVTVSVELVAGQINFVPTFHVKVTFRQFSFGSGLEFHKTTLLCLSFAPDRCYRLCFDPGTQRCPVVLGSFTDRFCTLGQAVGVFVAKSSAHGCRAMSCALRSIVRFRVLGLGRIPKRRLWRRAPTTFKFLWHIPSTNYAICVSIAQPTE